MKITRLKEIHKFAKEYLPDWFPAQVSYQTFGHRLNRMIGDLWYAERVSKCNELLTPIKTIKDTSEQERQRDKAAACGTLLLLA